MTFPVSLQHNNTSISFLKAFRGTLEITNKNHNNLNKHMLFNLSIINISFLTKTNKLFS